MSSPGFEALIKLAPLDASNELPRVFALNPATDRIEVGRASKNESKGLVAAKENAWFDSPIMSRQHAQFTLSVVHKGVCLRDNGSTHGTSVGGRRLQPQVDYSLSNDEIITFGVRVTSGELSYPAREFRFYFEWRPWSPESPVFDTTQNKTDSIRFHVPDEENDSFSDESREDSVQILDSHVRAFSVPSSDDDLGSEEEEEDDEDEDDEDDEVIRPSTPQCNEVEKPFTPTTPKFSTSEKPFTPTTPQFSTSEKPFTPTTPQFSTPEKPFTPTTPQFSTPENLGTTAEHPIEVWNEPTPAEDTELLSPSKARFYSRLGRYGRVGTSGVNTIDVEVKLTDNRTVICSNGEDETPGIYSPKSDVYSPKSDVYSPKPDVYSPKPDIYSPRSDIYSPRPDVYSPKQEHPEVHKGKALSAERPNPVPKSFSVHSSLNTLRFVEPSKEHRMAITHDDKSGDEADVLGRKPRSLAGSMREILHGKPLNNSRDDVDEVDEDDFDHDGCFLMSQVEYPERSLVGETTTLFPSASRPRVHFELGDNGPGGSAGTDAASRSNWSYRTSSSEMIDANPDTQIEAHRATQRPPSPSDAALAKNASNPALSGNWPYIRSHYRQSPPRDHDIPYLREPSQKAGPHWVDGFTGSAHHLRDQSFYEVPDPAWSSRYDDGPLTSHAQHHTLPTLPSSYSLRQNSVSTDQMTRKFNSLASQLSTGSIGDESRVTPSPSPPITNVTRLPEEPECRHKGNECHPARLNISDIVNPLADTTRNLKRKADEMISNEIEDYEMKQAAESLQQASPWEAESQELYFDDAQHRDTLIDGETNLFQSSSIDSTTISLQNQKDPTGPDNTGPARKKQKSYGSSAICISKFASGVLVGVAGAFAAFIATIPMSVQEEALQEIAPAL